MGSNNLNQLDQHTGLQLACMSDGFNAMAPGTSAQEDLDQEGFRIIRSLKSRYCPILGEMSFFSPYSQA